MLTHRNIVIVFVLLLAALVFLNSTHPVHWSIYVLVLLVFFSIESYGAYFIHSNFHVPAVCKGITTSKTVALTFDDGPAAHTEKVLDVLKELNIKATFFCIGSHIAGNENILKRIDAEGHLIGNHSYSHNFWFDLKTTASFVTDLQLADDAIKGVTGRAPVYFRPPYGVTTPGLARAIKKLKYTTVGWNIRSLDTSIRDRAQVLLRIKKRLAPGAIILLHDSTGGIDVAVRELVQYLHENNYSVVPLDTLIQKKAYA